MRYPPKIKPGTRIDCLVICQDIAPTLIELAGAKPGPQVQGRSLVPLFAGKKPRDWRKSFLFEYWAEQAMPWLVSMTYKAVRTDRHKYIHWVDRGRSGERDELYELECDLWDLKNLLKSRTHPRVRSSVQGELRRRVYQAISLS